MNTSVAHIIQLYIIVYIQLSTVASAAALEKDHQQDWEYFRLIITLLTSIIVFLFCFVICATKCLRHRSGYGKLDDDSPNGGGAGVKESKAMMEMTEVSDSNAGTKNRTSLVSNLTRSDSDSSQGKGNQPLLNI